MDRIKLYHYSNSDFKGYIKPDFFGFNTYSHYSARLSGVKRSYFYTDKNNKEFYFYGSKFCYIVKIDKNKLYNICEDKLKVYDRVKDVYKTIKNKGYSGISGLLGDFCGCVVLFKAIKINKRLTLTK